MLTVVMLFLVGGNPLPSAVATGFPDKEACEGAKSDALVEYLRAFKPGQVPPPLKLVCVERYRT